MSMLHISILKTLLAMTAFLGPALSYWEGYIGERYFTITGPTETKDFEGAKDWCKQRNSSLAVVSDNDTQEALVQYLISLQLNEQLNQMFIDLKLKQNSRTWYLINGSTYRGGLQEQNELAYGVYGYLNRHDNKFQVDGSQPYTSRNFICKFENTRFSSNSSNSHLDKDGCFVKYENESLSWFKARERCRNNGGDLAEFNYDSGTIGNPYGAPIDTSWLNTSFYYWVGIRYQNRYWKSSGSDDEVFYTSWSSDEPNNIYNECVCVDSSGNPAWWWTDCSCTQPRQFVCLKIVPTTIATTITTTPLTTILSSVPGSSVNVTQSTSSSRPINVLAIGLGAGIGGGVFLILLVVIIVLAVYFARRRGAKRNDTGTGSKFDNTPATTTSNIAPAAPNGSDIYAQVVPTTNRTAKSENDVNDVIYSRPEFSSSENSTQHGSDMKKTRQDKVLSVVLEGPSDVYANAASVS